MDDGTAVIIILYNPSEEDIGNAESVAKTYRGVIVDNSDLPFTNDSKIGRMHYVCNKANKGIAEAQNIGMRMMLGEKIQIHYNPNNPSISYERTNISGIIGGIVLILAGILSISGGISQ